MFMSTETAIVA